MTFICFRTSAMNPQILRPPTCSSFNSINGDLKLLTNAQEILYWGTTRTIKTPLLFPSRTVLLQKRFSPWTRQILRLNLSISFRKASKGSHLVSQISQSQTCLPAHDRRHCSGGDFLWWLILSNHLNLQPPLQQSFPATIENRRQFSLWTPAKYNSGRGPQLQKLTLGTFRLEALWNLWRFSAPKWSLLYQPSWPWTDLRYLSRHLPHRRHFYFLLTFR